MARNPQEPSPLPDPARLLSLCIDLMHKDRRALGFIPAARFEERIQLGQVVPAWENDEMCGYVLVGRARETLHIHQTAICLDARRFRHAANLVHLVKQRAERAGCHAIRLRCAVDLEANLFWTAQGFERIATVAGQNRTGRLINVYHLPIANGQPLLDLIK